MEKAKLMQLEIEEKRKLPANIKNIISTKIFQDLIVATIIMAYFCAVNFIFYKYSSNKFEEILKYFALIIIIGTVISFEISYRKNSIGLLVIGIELLICGIFSLYIPYLFIYTNSAIRVSAMILPSFLIVYYSIKSFIIFKVKQIEYRNSLSDVKDIISEKKDSYLDEKSGKTFKTKLKREKILRQKIMQEQKQKKVIKKL